MDKEKETFIQQCAIAAMQGIQESGKIGVALDAVPSELAKLSFDIAECMWAEYEKRRCRRIQKLYENKH